MTWVVTRLGKPDIRFTMSTDDVAKFALLDAQRIHKYWSSTRAQPAGGEGTTGEGLYGTLTLNSVAVFFSRLLGYVLDGDVFCDFGAGLAGC